MAFQLQIKTKQASLTSGQELFHSLMPDVKTVLSHPWPGLGRAGRVSLHTTPMSLSQLVQYSCSSSNGLMLVARGLFPYSKEMISKSLQNSEYPVSSHPWSDYNLEQRKGILNSLGSLLAFVLLASVLQDPYIVIVKKKRKVVSLDPGKHTGKFHSGNGSQEK